MTTDTVLTSDQRDKFVGDLVDYGTDFVAPLYAVVESIEQAVLQSHEVQRLREENIRLLGLVKEMAEHDTYETEYDGRMYSICHGCGAQDGEDHRSPSCVYARAEAAINAAMEKQL